MGKSTKVKIFLIVALVAAAACTTIGVMAFGGLFQSDRTEALKLLLQASERLKWSATNDYIGSEKMGSVLLKEGGQIDVSISELTPGDGIWKEILGSTDGPSSYFKTGAGIAAGWEGISDYTFNWNKKIDIGSGRTSDAVSIAKGEEKISYINCQDADEQWIVLPELLEGKVFHVTAKEKSDMFGEHISDGGGNIKDFLAFLQDFESFMAENSVKLQKEILFDRLKKDELYHIYDTGYEAVIPKETANAFLRDLTEILQKQEKEIFDEIGERTKAWSVSQDITFKIFGKDGSLGRMEAEIPIDGEMFEMSVDFTGEKGDSAVTFFCRGKIENDPISLSIKKSEKSKKICENAFDIELSEDETSLIHLVCKEQMSPDNGSYQVNVNWEDAEEHKYGIRAKGTIKDLKKGACVTYILDDIEISSDGAELLTMAVKYRLASGNTEVATPAGDMIEITSDTKDEDMAQYQTEILKNLQGILSRMGLLGGLFSGGSL